MCPLAPPPNDASIAKRLLSIFYVCHLQYLAQASLHGLRFVDFGFCAAKAVTLRVDTELSDVCQRLKAISLCPQE